MKRPGKPEGQYYLSHQTLDTDHGVILGVTVTPGDVYVLARLQYWSMMVQKDEDKLLKRLLNASDRERNSAKKKQAAELKKAEKRKAEVDGLFAKMYEDWSAGRITEYNFNMLSEKYQNEQKELETK